MNKLYRLELKHNATLSDLSPLSSLVNLNILFVEFNAISDLSPVVGDNLITDLSPLVDGAVARTLALGHQRPGIYENKNRAAYWDGKNEHNEPVASGVYFYTLTAGDFTATRKMLIMK